MAKDNKVRLIKAPQGLRQRAVNFTTGLELTLTDEVRAKIEAVIAESTDTFAQEVLEKLRDMRSQVRAAEDDELQRIFILSNIAEIAFDIKGMGGTFGYPLLSHLAKSLHDFVGKLGLPNEAQLEVISIHIDAMYVVLARGIGGTGGQMEKELLDNLGTAVAKVQD
jgi:predicted DNA-binding protein